MSHATYFSRSARHTRRRAATRAALLISGLMLAACGAKEAQTGFNDPYESGNRKVHAFNTGFDRTLLRPTSQAYGTVIPSPVRTGVGNFASNLSMPSAIVNAVLQGRGEDASKNTFRFLVNTTFGLGGLLDVASDMGLQKQDADFGQTLHTWGVGQGTYLEAPFVGPTTQRDLTGKIVDIVTDPVTLLLPVPESNYALVANGTSKVGDRYRYSDLVDQVLYESSDSYAQSRLLYMQNRRYQLGEAVADDTFDPYEDSNGK